MEKTLKEEVREQLAEMLANGLPQNCGEVVIREGEAVKQREPERVEIRGAIDAPARWLQASIR